MAQRDAAVARLGDLRRYDWHKLRGQLPYGKTQEDKQRRKKVFRGFDVNGNGYLSLAEVDKGVRDMGIDWADCKPAIIRAFNRVKDTAPAHTPCSNDYVTRAEFRLLLQQLGQMFELYAMFSEVDTSDDRRIDLSEFKKALPLMDQWGLKITDPEAAFREADRDGGGKILFDEFVDWALKKHLSITDEF
eukprot:TRINITY_DN16967_c0_g1_i1.p2 TRINITY_DN16967_c0_g1~~TRINITY_DN16967_c0_g1_i1.p2  ORF type:complete len:189 (+),score=73.29 TRINITY_DN16967_c0_g1_i1:55-621(+)